MKLPEPVIAALVVAILLFLAVVGCSPAASTSSRPIPAITNAGMEPWVVAHLAEGRARLEAASESPEAWGRFGQLLEAHRLTAAATACYRTASDLAPREFRWRYLLARLLDRDGAPDAAAEFLEAVTLRPNDVPARLGCAEALLRLGRRDEARAQFWAALELGGDALPFACRGLAQLLRDEGRTAEAITQLERARSAAPKFGEIHSLLAALYAKSGRATDAERELAAARALPSAYSWLDPLGDEVQAMCVSSVGLLAGAQVLLQSGRRDEGMAKLRELLVHLPDHIDARMSLAMALADGGRLPDARRELETVVTHHPERVDARVRLASLLLIVGEKEPAIAQIRAAVAVAPADPELAAFIGDLPANAVAALLRELGSQLPPRAYFELVQAVATRRPAQLVAAEELLMCLAASEDPSVRSPKEALAKARDACAGWGADRARPWFARACAQAELGDFAGAAESATKALELARRDGSTGLVQQIEGRMATWTAASGKTPDGGDR